jgi:hypothetical protein
MFHIINKKSMGVNGASRWDSIDRSCADGVAGGCDGVTDCGPRLSKRGGKRRVPLTFFSNILPQSCHTVLPANEDGSPCFKTITQPLERFRNFVSVNETIEVVEIQMHPTTDLH